MRILGSVVGILLRDLPVLIIDITHGSAVRSELVRHYHSRRTIVLHCFLQKPQSRELIPFLGDETLQDFAFMIDRSP
jgi:uncharacterized Fe-S cluster-containing protein